MDGKNRALVFPSNRQTSQQSVRCQLSDGSGTPLFCFFCSYDGIDTGMNLTLRNKSSHILENIIKRWKFTLSPALISRKKMAAA